MTDRLHAAAVAAVGRQSLADSHASTTGGMGMPPYGYRRPPAPSNPSEIGSHVAHI
jgi:hypothetical protein